MTKVNLYAPFAGVKDGLTLCTLLRDKKKLKEVLGVVEILDVRIAEINQAIETLGKASKMDALLREASQKNQDAAFVLNEAKESAGQIQQDAKTWADDLRSKLVKREKTVTAGEKALADGEARLKAGMDAWQADSAKSNVAIAKHEQTTARLLEQAKALKKRYETALASMKADVAAA